MSEWSRCARAALLAMLALSGCSRAPVDATRQIDDYPYIYPPTHIVKTASAIRSGKDVTVTPLRGFGPRCTREQVSRLLASDKKARGGERLEMMALGGSVFNGVSSMQINWWLSEWSPPAQVARALAGGKTDVGVPDFFRVPHYPDYGLDPYGADRLGKPHFRLGLDLETINLGRIETAIQQQGRLMSDFSRYRSTDGVAFNDNISFGGAAVEDLLFSTAASYRARLNTVRRIDGIEPDADDFWGPGPRRHTYEEIREHAKRVNGLTDVGKTAGPLKTLFFAENSSFVLNPGGDECIEYMTPLDQALLRQPKRLLLGVGSNSGLFTFMYNGQPVDKTCGDVGFSFAEPLKEQKRYVKLRDTAKTEFLRHMKMLLDQLALEGAGIEHIYVMSQLRPRMVANLDPQVEQGRYGIDNTYPPLQVAPGEHGYHAKYFLDFAPDGSARYIPGKDVEAADTLNAEINEELERLVNSYNRHGEKRFAFVDLKPLEQYDVKHADNAKRPGRPIVVDHTHIPELGTRQIYLDNRVLTFSRQEEIVGEGASRRSLGQRIRRGGIFSVDNLHPSVVGYALLAQRLLDSIVETEGVQLVAGAREAISPQMAYARDNAGGNVLRRQDVFLASREDWIQFMFDAEAALKSGARDCLRLPGDLP